ncbi:MAG: TlpA family protein disulfide reductase [Candidatus Omnitrophica bacterium]|nr:TlpA family protein disulfide reductase [Candidatus Omnitrophota bacterium]
MKHIVDERHCPNCRHDTGTWRKPCPGCGRTPANTLAGRQLLQRQQRRLWAIRAIPPLVFVVAVAARLIADRSHASSVDHAGESGAQDSQPGAIKPAAGAASVIATSLDLKAYRGKYVILDFWATWCGPCRYQLPALKRFYQDIERETEVVLVSVSLDRDRRFLERFVRREQMRWPQVIQTEGFRSALARQYQVYGIPHMTLIGPDGTTLLQNASLPLVRRALQPHLGQRVNAQQHTAAPGTIRGTLELDGG